MNILNLSTSKKVYCDSIKSSSYEQAPSNNTGPCNDKEKPRLFDNCAYLLISLFDPTASVLSGSELLDYCRQRSLEIATQLDESKQTNYDCYKYHKSFKLNLIQSGLQIPNSISSIVYLSDLYNLSPILYCSGSHTATPINEKENNLIRILYQNRKFQVITEEPSFPIGSYEHLSECFVLDIKSLSVYQPYLQPISKYKIDELTSLASERNISLTNNGKKKRKKELYEEINLFELRK